MKKTESVQDVLYTVCHNSFEPIPPSEIVENFPPVLEDIILKAIAQEEFLRYQSVRELREDLERYLELADDDTLRSGTFLVTWPIGRFFGLGFFSPWRLHMENRTQPFT